MANSLPYILTLLAAGIAVIVLFTTRYKIPAFFALLIACLVVGLGIGLPLSGVVTVIKDGFGNIMKSLGLIIVLGTTLGLLLEYTGATTVMASFLLKKLGNKYASWAMSITGFVVGMPIFCDSGFIVLSGLNRSMAKRTGISMATMSVSLASGLYAVHCLIPPHPGSSAAAATIGVDFGKLILIGIVVAIPAMIVGNLWANYAGRKEIDLVTDDGIVVNERGNRPSLLSACLPIFVPIILIGLKSFLTSGTLTYRGRAEILLPFGDPVIALLIGVLLAFFCKKNWKRYK